MAVVTTELVQGFPPDWQVYLDKLSPKDRQESLENMARYERKAKRQHNRMRKMWLHDFGEDLGPYKSINEWFWEDYRKKQVQSLTTGVYGWLGLEPSDTLTKREVKNAYRRKARKLHPDVGGDAEAFKQLYAAYREVLKVAID